MVERGVIGSTYAVDALARIALVRVLSKILALRDVERIGGDDLVQSVRCPGEELASIAVAVCISALFLPNNHSDHHRRRSEHVNLPEDVTLLLLTQLSREFCLATMALSGV